MLLKLILFGFIFNYSNDYIQVHKALEFKSATDHSRHDFSGEGGLILRCEPVLVPTMPPGGGAADIRVKPCNSRVVDIHLRGHLIARFTCLEQSKPFALCFTRNICVGCNCTEGVSYTVEGQVT